MRVCCLCESWASGGIESFLCNVLTRLDLTDLEVDVVAAQLYDSFFTEKLRAHGIRFYELSGSQRRVYDNHRQFRAILRERHYDVLHLNAFQGLSLAYLHIAKEEGVPVRIAHSHNTALRKSATRPIKLAIHRWARERYTKDATALWACSKDAAAFLFDSCELQKRGFRFIPNGIDVERFRFDPVARESLRHELGLDDKFVIGHVGRLCYQKNQSFLLDVFARVVKKRPESALLLVGEGEDRLMLEEKAESLGVRDKVLFYGVTDQIERLYWAMDVFAFPSLFEGFGIAVIEAQAAGLPVICSEHVPGESRIVGCEALPLQADIWVEELARDRERLADGEKTMEDARFHVSHIAEEIGRSWLCGERNYVNLRPSEKGQAPAV